jgi:hypothetical protein
MKRSRGRGERERTRRKKMTARRTEQVNICFRYVLPPPSLRSRLFLKSY